MGKCVKVFVLVLMIFTIVGCQGLGGSGSGDIEEIIISNFNPNGQTQTDIIVTITDTEQIKKMSKFVDSAPKISGILDMLPPNYFMVFKYDDNTVQEFNLHLEEDSGTLVNAEDTHKGYSLKKDFIEFFEEIIMK